MSSQGYANALYTSILSISMSCTCRLYKLYKASERLVQGISMTAWRGKMADQTTPTPPTQEGKKIVWRQ